MEMNSKFFLLAAMCLSLSGCGPAMMRTAAPSDAAAAIQNPQAGQGHKGHRAHQGRHGGGMGMLGLDAQALGLTDDQKTQLKAIAAKYRPAKPDPAARKALRDKAMAV